MDSNFLDKSNYFRGLILLIGKDKKITESEKGIIKSIAKILNYNQEFVDRAMNDLFANKYIVMEPPEFSNLRFVEIFIRDGLRIALTDGVIDLREIHWLMSVAQKNRLSKQWFFSELEYFLDNYNSKVKDVYEIQKLKIS